MMILSICRIQLQRNTLVCPFMTEQHSFRTQQRVRITYFVPDNKKAGGAYITCSGCVKKFDEYEHTVIMEDKTVIPIEQISDIDGEMFGEMY